jgi:hypothetical protein
MDTCGVCLSVIVGFGMSKMELLSFLVIFMSREPFRLTALRHQGSDDRASPDAQPLTNLSWGALPVGAIISCIALAHFGTSGWGCGDSIVPGAATCIVMFVPPCHVIVKRGVGRGGGGGGGGGGGCGGGGGWDRGIQEGEGSQPACSSLGGVVTVEAVWCSLLDMLQALWQLSRSLPLPPSPSGTVLHAWWSCFRSPRLYTPSGSYST